MNNKLEEILADFDESFLMEFSYKTHDRLKKFLQEKLVDYARSKVPDFEQDEESSQDEEVGFDTCRIMILDSIDQDLQSLNK